MSTIPKPEDSSILYRVVFDILPNREIDPILEKKFDEKIGKHPWILLQNGLLSQNRGADFYVERTLFVSSDHSPTISSLCFLEEVLSGKILDERISNWCLKVFIPEVDEEDFVICVKGSLYLRKMKNAWEAMFLNQAELLQEIQRDLLLE